MASAPRRHRHDPQPPHDAPRRGQRPARGPGRAHNNIIISDSNIIVGDSNIIITLGVGGPGRAP